VGSTFGTGALGPHDFDEGWEHLFEGDLVWKRLVTLGFYLRPWQTVRYVDSPAIGPFEGDAFEPDEWKPRVPTAAFLAARADDTFWAARRVMAFSDAMIRALAQTGQYSDETAAAHLANVLIQRRDKIGRTYLNAVNPVVSFALDGNGTFTFENAAAATGAGAEPEKGYSVSWARFDNATGESASLGAPVLTTDRKAAPPSALPTAAGSFVKIQVAAWQPSIPSWATPVDVYFRRDSTSWALVGVDRLPGLPVSTASGARQ
jgi:hypothetical protein